MHFAVPRQRIIKRLPTPLNKFLFAAIFAGVTLMASSVWAQRSHGSKGSTDSPIDPLKPSGRGTLREIVQTQCVMNWLQHHDPSPCDRVVLVEQKPSSSGYAILADAEGGAHYLLIPTQRMTGLDSNELIDPDTPNYFGEAWHARDLITKFVGHAVPRTAIGLAVGIARSRSQDQFHIHIQCLRQDVADALLKTAERITEEWSDVTLGGAGYQALRIQGQSLDGSNVYELLATLKPGMRQHLADYTLVIAGMHFVSGPGFVLLTGTGQSGDLLLDSTCAVAGGGG